MTSDGDEAAALDDEVRESEASLHPAMDCVTCTRKGLSVLIVRANLSVPQQRAYQVEFRRTHRAPATRPA